MKLPDALEPKPSTTLVQRSDGWINALTGIGSLERDKTRANAFEQHAVTREEAETLWRCDDVAARIVTTIPDEMTREGYDLKIEPDEKEAGDLSPEEEALGLPGEKSEGVDPEADPDAEPTDPNAKPEDLQEKKPDDPEAEGSDLGTEDPDKKPPEDAPAERPASAKPGEAEARDPSAPASGATEPPAPGSPDLKKKKLRADGFGGKPFGGGKPGAKPFGGGGGFGGPPAPPAKPPGVIKKPDDDTRRQAEEATAYAKRLGFDPKTKTALEQCRAFGGSALVVGADDGNAGDPYALAYPLNEDGIKTIKWLMATTCAELQAVKWYSDPNADKFGDVELYRLQPETSYASGGAGAFGMPEKKQAGLEGSAQVGVYIHESRVIKFQGITISKRQLRSNQFPGWGDSVFTRCVKVLADYGITWRAAAIMLHDFAQGVFKMKDLAQLVATNRDEVVVRRMQLVDMSRSVSRSIMLDSEEDFERKSTSLAGYPDMLDRFSSRMAMAAEMPVELLTGDSPAGLGATGASTIRMFYDRCAARQKSELLPQLERMYELIFRAADGPTKGKAPKNWSITFRPLWQMTAKEEADVRFVQAQVDEKYINLAVLTPEEVTASRFGGDEYSTETTIDMESRAQLAVEHEAKQAEFEVQSEEHAKASNEAMKKGKMPGAEPGALPGKPAPDDKKPGANPFAK